MRSIQVLICTLFLAISGYGLSARANVDVTCANGDCLANGWQVFDTAINDSSTVLCRNSNCNTEGWTGVYKEVAQDVTQCKGASCFTFGWTVFDSVTNALKVEVTCHVDYAGVSDCLRWGWEVRNYQTRTAQSVFCLNGDCRTVGWDTYTPGYPMFPTRCKVGGCFQNGWVSYH